VGRQAMLAFSGDFVQVIVGLAGRCG